MNHVPKKRLTSDSPMATGKNSFENFISQFSKGTFLPEFHGFFRQEVYLLNGIVI
jgi:hypothetical protein